MARAQSSVSALGASVGRIGTQAFVVAGAAAVAFGTAAAIGIKKAFDLGGSLADMSAISGRSAKEILLLRRALEDAGVSMEKIDRFILTGQDRGKVIARALENMSSGDWRDAAASVGRQADILDKNAKTFDRVSDLLNRSGQKFQGFFVGAAGSIGKALLPILEKFDKMDFASQGEKFGAALLKGTQALVGVFRQPQLLGNVLVGVFKTAITFFRDGMLQAFVGIGSALAATLLESFQDPIARLQAAFEEVASGDTGKRVDIGIKTKSADALQKVWGEGNPIVKALRKQADQLQKEIGMSFESRVEAIKKSGGPRLGFDEGQNAAGFRKSAGDQIGTALDAMENIAKEALAKASANIENAAKVGRNFLPAEMAGGGGNRLNKGGFTFVPSTGGIDDSLFARNKAASDAEFASRWGGGAPAEKGKTDRSDKLLEDLNLKLDTLNLTNKAQLETWTGE